MAERTYLENSDKGFISLMVVLAVVGLGLIVGTWMGSHYVGLSMAQLQILKRAQNWSDTAVSSLQYGKVSFEKSELSTADKGRLYDLMAGNDIYRYTLINKDGKIFWSSRFSVIGKVLGDSNAEASLARGEAVVVHDVKPAIEVDGRSGNTRRGYIDPQQERNVAQVTLPVLQSGRYVGAVAVFIDSTDLLKWYQNQINRFAPLACGLLASVVLAMVVLTIMFARQRRQNIRALMRARDIALSAELEAKNMAEELKRVNEDVVHLNRELENNVRRLREAQDEIIRKGKLAQLGQLTATVAHEIRNPLGGIRTAAFVLERKFKQQIPDIGKPLERIGNGVVRCDAIITELLDFARSNSLQSADTPVDAWLKNLVEEQAAHLPAQVSIECRLGLGETHAVMDATRMQRVIINFLTNASEAMVGKPDKPIENPTADPNIVVSTGLSARGIEITVSDNGPGITAENMNKIREPLFTTKSFGVGLGIPAVEKILEQHQGGLDIESKPGKGAKFTAWFPLKLEVKEVA